MIALMARDMLSDMGATVIGPAGTITQGLAFARAEKLDAAVLDVNLRGQHIDPVVDILRERGIPILFASGYGAEAQKNGGSAPVIDKPYTQDSLLNGLRAAVANAARPGGSSD